MSTPVDGWSTMAPLRRSFVEASNSTCTGAVVGVDLEAKGLTTKQLLVE